MRQSSRTSLCIVGLLALMLVVIDARGAVGDPDQTPIIRFAPYAQNPVLSRTSAENWGGDCGTVFAPRVLKHQERYYLFYTGSCNRQAQPAGIGFATSTDGIHWDKYEKNPILEPDGAGYDAMCVSYGVPVVDGDGWVMYYAGNSQPCAGPGRFIGRATAARPDGTWQRGPEPVLTAGEPGEWDEGFIMPHAVIRTEKGYVMYYSGGSEYLVPLPRLVGMATSPDGITWTKYNDPATTQSPYAFSDPVLEMQDDGTTTPLSAWAVDVAKTDRGLEMFFSATCPDDTKQGCPGFIGYATSADGVHWKTFRTPETLVLTQEQVNQGWAKHCICYPSIVKESESYKLYFTGCADAMNDCQIGLATGTIVWRH